MLLDILKGPGAAAMTDEGFVSFYMDTPRAVFPAVSPLGVPRSLPAAILRPVTLRNFAQNLPTPRDFGSWDPYTQYQFRRQQREANGPDRGNRHEYEQRVKEARLRRPNARLDATWCALSCCPHLS